MAIVIIVEDGSEVANANAYISVADVRTYAANRGVTLSNDDDAIAAMLIKATDYLETFACQYLGVPTSSTQSLQWPRKGVVFNCDEYPSTAIPKNLIAAQAQAVMAIAEGIALQPNFTAQDYVVKEKVDVIETTYADPIQVGVKPVLTAVDALLAPLFGKCANSGAAIRTIRV